MKHLRPVRWLILAVLLISYSSAAFAGVYISVRIGPPALPVYAQPVCPGPGYIWTPGYWAWNDDEGYYWVPGTWVMAPVGMYWTPGYWGWNEGFYIWHAGYWGPHVGFYGGINYGYGYGGDGYYGGEWRGRNLYYNRSVTNVNVVNVTNVYNKTVIVNNTTVNRVSYNGGNGGVMARPSPQQLAVERERHREALPQQIEHQQAASRNRQLFARENQGRPPVAATVRPADFRTNVVPAREAGAAYHPPAMSPREARGPANGNDRPMTPANNSNARGNRPFNPPNANERPKSNDGFRPFNPPNSRGSNAQPMERNDRPGNARPTNDRPTSDRPSNDRPSNDRLRNDRPSNERGRNSMQNAQSNPMYKDNRNSGNNPMYENRDKRQAAPPPRESRPQQESRPMPRDNGPRQSVPQREAAPQRHQNPPQREAAPPPQRRESAPRNNNQPRPESRPEKDRGPGRR